ncbi:hypothetical protein, partial [Collinsella sp. CLA-JM-H32B]|uniref:hypothetical protein n=1 Tax=Collinsella sp. CLA-JM-H32B TaxID=3136221 RepID=UPI0032C0CF64
AAVGTILPSWRGIRPYFKKQIRPAIEAALSAALDKESARLPGSKWALLSEYVCSVRCRR